jgi:hypothetical protein
MMALNSKRIVDLATNLRLPAMYQTGQFIEEGGLMVHGVNYGDLYCRAGIMSTRSSKGPSLPTYPLNFR